MELLQGALALVIVVLFPLLDRGKLANLRVNPTRQARVAVYRRAILVLWSASAAALVIGPGRDLFMVQFPTVGPWMESHRMLATAAALAAGAFFVATLGQGLACLHSAAWRQRVAPAFASLKFLLPVSSVERRWWVLLSLSAGICEELLYRGYLVHFLIGCQQGLLTAWLLSSLAFGLAHLYQGWHGVLTSFAMGLVFGAVAIATGSLFLSIVLHALIDLQVLWMYRPGLDEAASVQSPSRT
jgi:membrane protease YdiL (CAAX protease family)